ncbi:uncharacterized protein N7498_001673 [Penicillium cinerascens]|uniref:Hydrophobin n=1 Tax=Penicillium cinerascens TaxID=70096 RepID=A0A9W9N8S4_9EURO|nr:uncharacterized protein N7498_001673 [Penicillium cinerascens]KAJ5215266.1 hypothetical protein N7498_001673 [Penicillium cinerascens]
MKLPLAFVISLVPAAMCNTANPTSGGDCNNGGSQVCCSGVLNCLVQSVGDACSNQAYCCQTDAPVGTLLNVALLNCVQM